LNKALGDLSRATAAASQAKDLASKAQAHSGGSDDRIKAAARVYAKSVLTFNQAAEEHVKTFGSKKSELLKSNADIIDCAHYGGCNNNENGVGGVGVNVDNTQNMLAQKKAAAAAKAAALAKCPAQIASSVAQYETFKKSFVSAQAALQTAQSALKQAQSKGPQCYSVTVPSTCSLSGHNCHGSNKNIYVSVNVKLPRAGLHCPTRVDKKNWLTKDHHGDFFDVSTTPDHATVTRRDQKGPWGMTVIMKCCDPVIEKAEAALGQATQNYKQHDAQLNAAEKDASGVRDRCAALAK